MKKNIVFFIVAVFCLAEVNAQPQEVIGEGLEGADLIAYLQSNYQVTNSLGYGPARDVMYGEIDNFNDSLRCVYTGYTIPLDPSQGDPSQMAYELDINCEHTWPQSLFDENEPMRSDMHHLFPTWVTANGARANYPFDEIPDNQTDSWYYDAEVYQNPPAEDIREEASELLNNTSFEPPASHKGDVARAIYYFWTVYQDRSEFSDDADFFEGMMDVLREWHYLDPADQWEIDRSLAIAGEQGNSNPFVHDSTLVRRAYYPGSSSVGENRNMAETFITVNAYPNPFNSSTQISVSLEEGMDLQMVLYNTLGQKTLDLGKSYYSQGVSRLLVNANGLPTGNYFLVLMNDGKNVANTKILLLK